MAIYDENLSHSPSSPEAVKSQDDSEKEEDLFAELHRLEETFYREGHALGQVDGEQLGRVEGQVFGTKRAFDRFFDISRLHGHVIGLGNQIPGVLSSEENAVPTPVPVSTSHSSEIIRPTHTLQSAEPNSPSGTDHNVVPNPSSDSDSHLEVNPSSTSTYNSSIDITLPNLLTKLQLGPLPAGISVLRVERHMRTLYALTEPASLSIQNTEDDVSTFDDRMKRAQAKATVLARQLPGWPAPLTAKTGNRAQQQQEGSSTTRARRGRGAVDGVGDGGEEDEGGQLAGVRVEEANIEDSSILRARH